LSGSTARRRTILLIGTFDTKFTELSRVRAAIEQLGADALALDASVGGKPSDRGIEFGAEQIANASGTTLAELAALGRGEAVGRMQLGVASVVVQLALQGRIHGALCVGGAGAHLVGAAFQALDIGFPKLVLSPLASGMRQFEPYTGLRDVAVMHSVADVAGVNQITDRVYRQAAGYIVGAARAMDEVEPAASARSGRPLIAASMNGNTTPAVNRAREALEAAGYDVVAFHANGAGGRAMEDLVSARHFNAVLDYTTTELGFHEVGGLMDPGATRMEAAGRVGIAQVLVPGCVDFVTTGRYEEAQRAFPGRRLYRHNPELTLVRLTAAEMGRMGEVFALKASAAEGPVAVCIPTQGFSVPDSEGGPFWDAEADFEFITALQANASSRVQIRLADAHVNDERFVDVVVETLLSMLQPPAGAAATQRRNDDVVR
jgi:uncharacterized protein (UPF0261 family)